MKVAGADGAQRPHILQPPRQERAAAGLPALMKVGKNGRVRRDAGEDPAHHGHHRDRMAGCDQLIQGPAAAQDTIIEMRRDKYMGGFFFQSRTRLAMISMGSSMLENNHSRRSPGSVHRPAGGHDRYRGRAE